MNCPFHFSFRIFTLLEKTHHVCSNLRYKRKIIFEPFPFDFPAAGHPLPFTSCLSLSLSYSDHAAAIECGYCNYPELYRREIFYQLAS